MPDVTWHDGPHLEQRHLFRAEFPGEPRMFPDAGEQRRHIGNLGFTPGEQIKMRLENRRIPQGPARVHDGIHARFGEAAYTVLRREQVPAGDDG